MPGLHHLSGTGVTTGLYLPTPPDLPGGKLSEQLISLFAPRKTLNGNRDVHGISTHKVCPSSRLPGNTVRSYRTFSPLPRHECRGGYFLRHSLFPITRDPPVRWCGALRCPDFPPRHECRGDGVARSAMQSYNERGKEKVCLWMIPQHQECISSKARTERPPLPFCPASVQWSVVEVCSQRLPERRNT